MIAQEERRVTRTSRHILTVVVGLVLCCGSLAHADFYGATVELGAVGTAAVVVELRHPDGSVSGAGLLGGVVYEISGQIPGPFTVTDPQGVLVLKGNIDAPEFTLFGVGVPGNEEGQQGLRLLLPDGSIHFLWHW